MKANAPEKIYLYPSRFKKDKILDRWFTTRYNQDSVEYIRTDTFIEKAAEWLKEQDEMIGVSFEEDFIERFIKAMTL